MLLGWILVCNRAVSASTVIMDRGFTKGTFDKNCVAPPAIRIATAKSHIYAFCDLVLDTRIWMPRRGLGKRRQAASVVGSSSSLAKKA